MINYTTKELKAMEPAARLLCAKQEKDPDLMLQEQHPTVAGVVTPIPQWAIAARELVYLSQMLTSLKEAALALPKVH